jgi:hypothetical protein
MWVLTICTGIFLGMCGDVIKYEYKSVIKLSNAWVIGKRSSLM